MEQTAIQNYCRRYFQATGCPILRDEQAFLQVELPKEIDKELTERPYYWIWAETMGEEVPPSVLNLAFDPDRDIEGIESAELVALGCFRLEKIFESASRRGRFVCMYQTETSTAVRVPFLLTSVKISCIADRRKDEIRTYGVNLKSRTLIPEMYEQVRALPLTADLPNSQRDSSLRGEFLLSSLRAGWDRIKEAVAADIAQDDHTWAEAAQAQLSAQVEQLETYYQSLILDNENESNLYTAERELRIAELTWRCKPRILVAPIHFALLYLDPTQFTGTSVRT